MFIEVNINNFSEYIGKYIKKLKMSKATLSTQFRKVDVDELDEERFQDDTTGEQEKGSVPSDAEIQSLLNAYLFTIKFSEVAANHRASYQSLVHMFPEFSFSFSKKIFRNEFSIVCVIKSNAQIITTQEWVKILVWI